MTRTAQSTAIELPSNVVLMVGTVGIAAGCLWTASHATSPLVVLIAAILFGFVNNTLFSLMHEAVHGMFHSNRTVNEAAGNIAAAFFPTIFVVQRLSHLTHHKNNRSDVERFDYYEPSDNHVLKVAQWYSILTGLYWLFIPVFTTVYALFGGFIPWRRIVATDGVVGRQTSATAYFESLQLIPMSSIRFGYLLTIAVQALLIWGLDLSFWRWAACYACFGLIWSSLQYADHAFSALDKHEGAWNLTVSPFTRLTFLNYHFHLCHHRDITVPWRKLPDRVRNDDPTIPFKHMLYFMWAGPRLKPGETLPAATLSRHALTVNVFLTVIMTLVFGAIYAAGDALHLAATWRTDLTTPFDRAVPFYPAAAAIYLCVSPMLMAAPFVFRTPERLLPFGAAIVVELLIALAIYYVFPTELAVQRYDSSGLVGSLMWIADTINLDGNNLPSLHVALAASAAWGYAPLLRPRWRLAAFALAGGIAVSTLLTHQHVVADVIAGLALAAIGMGIVYPYARRVLMETKAKLGSSVLDGSR
jgi:fatty acid desaturase